MIRWGYHTPYGLAPKKSKAELLKELRKAEERLKTAVAPFDRSCATADILQLEKKLRELK